MESVDFSRRHRRRGRRSKKRQHYSINNLRPGRAPLGLLNTAHLESEGEDSDQEQPPKTKITAERQPSIQARLFRLLSSTQSLQQQPEAELRPLLSKDMSGLGAQARAAEYAAATAARARQVSREAGDQKLPPKAAPVSLSTLAKAHSAGRNKGPKAWKPLNMDDITESSDDGSKGKESGRDTPQTLARMALERTSSFPYRQSSESSTRVEDIRVNIPTAPRAMITSNAPTTVTAPPGPRRNQLETIVNPPARQVPQNIYASPVSFHHGGLPYPAMPPHFYSLHPDILGTHLNREAAQFPRFGGMIVPGDLSPTKQQQKFAMLGQTQYAAYANNSLEASADLLPHRMLPQYSLTYYDQLNAADASITGNPCEWNASTCGGTYVDYGVDQHPLQEHLDIGYVSEREGGFKPGIATSAHKPVPIPYSVTPTNYASNGDSAPKSYRSRAACSGFQYRRLSLIPTSETKRQTIPVTYDYGEPYDCKSKMQSFVAEAAQETLACKGKTVLHNPDLYKEVDQPQEKENPSYNNTNPSPPTGQMDSQTVQDESRREGQRRPTPWAVRSRLSDGTWEITPLLAEQGDQSKINRPPSPTKGEPEIIPNGIKNRAPGLGFLNMVSHETIVYEPIIGEPPSKRLNPTDQLGSVEWAHFRPITSIERERVRACMAKAAADLAPNIPRPRLFDKGGISEQQDDLKQSQEWFRRDLRGERAFRAQLPIIAEKHAILRRAAARHVNGGSLPNDFKLGVDDGIAASIIMGEVIANLSSYVLGNRKSAEQRKNFHKVKIVPEFAIERGGVSGASRSSDSYFDDQEGGFQSAPVRIARDPRFRPQGNEGLKLKLEEEWKNRHEMYGRRVL